MRMEFHGANRTENKQKEKHDAIISTRSGDYTLSPYTMARFFCLLQVVFVVCLHALVCVHIPQLDCLII